MSEGGTGRRFLQGLLLLQVVLCACSSPPPVPTAPPGPAELDYSVEVPGKTSIEVDRDVAARVEQALTAVPGVARVQLVSRAGRLHVHCVLAPGAAPESMRGPIVTRLADSLRAEGRSATAVRTASSSNTRLAYTVSTTGLDPRTLAAWHDATFPSVQNLPGLVDAETCGALRAELHVAIDPNKLAAREVGLENVLGPLQGTFGSVAAVAARDLGGVTPVPVSDVATVMEASAPSRCRAMRDGVPVLLVTARLDPRADSTRVRTDVNARLAGVAAPPGLHVEPLEPTGPVATLAFLLAPGASWEDSTRMASIATQALRRVPGVAHVIARIGASDLAPVGARETDLEVELALAHSDVMGRANLERVLVANLKAIPGMQVRVQDGVWPERTVRIVGEDVDALARLGDLLAQTMRGLQGVEDAGVLDSGREPVSVVQLDRLRALQVGITGDVVDRAVKAATDGIMAGNMVAGFRRLPIRVILGRALSGSAVIPPDLAIPLRGGSVPLSSFATVTTNQVPETVAREGGHRMVRLWVRLANEALWPGVRAAIEPAVRPPPGIAIVWE